MASRVFRLLPRSLHHKLLSCSNIQVTTVPWSPRAVQHIHSTPSLLQVRKAQSKESSKDIDVQRERPYAHLTLGQKVARAGTDLGYLLVIVAGVGIAGILFYTVGSELFSASGPNAVYSRAFKKCINDVKVLDALGQPVKGHGETNRRGRRRHVQHTEFVTSTGEQHTRIKFYLAGAFRTAVVHAETFKNSKGKQEFEFLVVELDGYPPQSITLERRERQPTLPSLF